MGFYSSTLIEDRGVVFEKRAVRFFRGVHRRNARPCQTKSPANKGCRAVVLRTTAPGVPLYGYRHLNTELGRWPSRDPIGESGGLNLYGFVANAPTFLIDALGNAAADWGRTVKVDPMPSLSDGAYGFDFEMWHHVPLNPSGAPQFYQVTDIPTTIFIQQDCTVVTDPLSHIIDIVTIGGSTKLQDHLKSELLDGVEDPCAALQIWTTDLGFSAPYVVSELASLRLPAGSPVPPHLRGKKRGRSR